MLTAHLLTAAASSSGTDTSLATTYYLVAIIGGLGAMIGGPIAVIRFYFWQRSRWQTDGAERTALTTEIKNNTKAAADNTDAVTKLAGKLETFAGTVQAEFDRVNDRLIGLGDRVTRIEAERSAQRTPGQR